VRGLGERGPSLWFTPPCYALNHTCSRLSQPCNVHHAANFHFNHWRFSFKQRADGGLSSRTLGSWTDSWTPSQIPYQPAKQRVMATLHVLVSTTFLIMPWVSDVILVLGLRLLLRPGSIITCSTEAVQVCVHIITLTLSFRPLWQTVVAYTEVYLRKKQQLNCDVAVRPRR